MEQEFRRWVEKHRESYEREEQENEARYKEFEATFNDFLVRLKGLREKETKERGEMRSSVSSKGFEDPPEIDKIKKLLEKLKSLIPQKWWSGPLRDILDKILQNLSPQNPEEHRRLLTYLDEVYEPGLRLLLTEWRQQLKMEAYERYARAIFKELLDQEIRDLER